MTTPTPVLSLSNLGHRYGSRATFHGLELQLASGALCCLLGPSGCGKTTVLRCIGGFEKVSEGEIRLDGELVGSASLHVPPEARRIGMVFQDYALFPHLDVLRNVGFGVPDRRLARQRAMELLQTVGLADAAGRYPHELSGGQQQRVALARALAPRPRLLLLDEPFSNLDVDLREQLAAEVRNILKASGTTAVFVTHDQHEAFALADEVAVMHQGRIQQIAGAYELYHRPNSRFVADFIGQGVFIPGEVVAAGSVRTELGVMRANGSGKWQTGSHVDLLLRPDDVIHDDGSSLRAEVCQRAFRGAEFLYTLRLASGVQLLSLVPSHHDHAVGERIGIRIEPDHVVAFARD